MRIITAFNRIIAIEGVAVSGVTFAREGVVVTIRRRALRDQRPCLHRRRRTGAASRYVMPIFPVHRRFLTSNSRQTVAPFVR